MRDPIGKFYAFLEKPVAYAVRFALLAACVPLAMSWGKPLWRISMEAPQYPNGLWMEVYPHKLIGGHDDQDLREINTLNHYIGMHPIHQEDFAELGWIPFVIGGLFLLTLRVAAVGNVRALIDLAVSVFYALGFLGARFVYQLYNFGHHLDPRAPFKIEPFTPAIYGSKQIANFTTHSFPQLGTQLIAVFALGVAAVTIGQLLAGRVAAIRASLFPPPPAPPAKT
jgi:copper chaperone NosL